MALINCPECNKQVSDQAKTCPNCGFQIADYYYRIALNQRIEEREKQKAERSKKTKKIIIISSISLVLIVALVFGFVQLCKWKEIKRFSTEEEMKSYVEGVFIEEISSFSNYRITIDNDYITVEEYGKNVVTHENFSYVKYKYHIAEYDYKNGKIITDQEIYYYTEKDENDVFSTITKAITNEWQDEFIVKYRNIITHDEHKYQKPFYELNNN